jgi:hypothetical protein
VLGASFGDDSPRRHEGHEGVAIEVHRHLGPGLLESIYAVARYREPWLRGGGSSGRCRPGLVQRVELEHGLRLDSLVESAVIVEL